MPAGSNISAMALPADYHMHTPLCRHAVGEPTEYAAQAEAEGLDEIGFTDHSPMRRDDFDNWRMRLDQLDEYVENVHRAREEHPQLTIRLGLEVDYIPGHEDWIRELSARHRWDYFIGSVHYISDSWDVDNPEKISQWKERDLFEVWQAYVDRLTRAADSRLFEIIGHADLPKKFGHFPDARCTALFAGFFKVASRAGVAIELNTAGLRKDCREIYPNAVILQMAHAAGVPITFGSDAHAPQEVGANFADAIALGRSAGYTHSCRFESRTRRTVAIPG